MLSLLFAHHLCPAGIDLAHVRLCMLPFRTLNPFSSISHISFLFFTAQAATILHMFKKRAWGLLRQTLHESAHFIHSCFSVCWASASCLCIYLPLFLHICLSFLSAYASVCDTFLYFPDDSCFYRRHHCGLVSLPLCFHLPVNLFLYPSSLLLYVSFCLRIYLSIHILLLLPRVRQLCLSLAEQ